MFRVTVIVIGVCLVSACPMRGEPALNPKYKQAPPPGPALAMPIVECKHVDKGIKNERQRELFMAAYPRELWRAAGLPGEPQLDTIRYSDPLCEEFINREKAGYAVNARVRSAVEGRLAGRPEQTLMVITYFFPYECNERTATVRDQLGRSVGTIGTGTDDCGETSEVWINVLVLTPMEIVWFSGTTTDDPEYTDAAARADQMFRGFPRQVLGGAPGA